MAHDVFVSYASQDKTIADAVCASLESKKIRCWVAPRDVLPGITYGEAIINGINQSRLLVLVFSSNSNNSPQVMREIERAVHKGIPVIPLRIDNVIPTKAMEYFVSSSHWLDAMTPPLEKHLHKLGETIQLILASETEKETDVKTANVTTQVSPSLPWWKKYSKALLFGIVVVLVVALVVAGLNFLPGSSIPVGSNELPDSKPASSPISSTTNTQLKPLIQVGESKVLFQDDFSNPESGFVAMSDDNRLTNYDKSEFSFTVKKWNYSFWAINQKAGLLEDMIAEVDTRIFSGSNQTYSGLVFRFQKNTSDFYCFVISGEGNCSFRKRSNDQWTFVKDWMGISSANMGTTSNHIRAIVKGKQGDLYVNNKLIASMVDIQPASGNIGLIMITKVAPSCCHFDNLKISSIDSMQKPDTTPSPPTPKPEAISVLLKDPVDDLFDKAGVPIKDEAYLDILESEVFATDSNYSVKIKLNGQLPTQTPQPSLMFEWDIYVDADSNPSTGDSWPLVTNDIGFEYIVRTMLLDSSYWSEVYDVTAKKRLFTISSTISNNIIELTWPKTVNKSDTFSYIIAAKKYGERGIGPDFMLADKAPNKGHTDYPK